YRWLLDHGISADHIAFTGDSCGGGLAITTQLRARELRLPLPTAAMPFSPWVDMEATVESYVTNRDRDAFFSSGLVRGLAGIFLGEGGDARAPLANPLDTALPAPRVGRPFPGRGPRPPGSSGKPAVRRPVRPGTYLHPSSRRRGPSG